MSFFFCGDGDDSIIVILRSVNRVVPITMYVTSRVHGYIAIFSVNPSEELAGVIRQFIP